MNDRYYVFNQGRKRGPFSLDDLLNETERGRIEYENFCLRIGASTCEKVRQALDWEDEHLIQASKATLVGADHSEHKSEPEYSAEATHNIVDETEANQKVLAQDLSYDGELDVFEEDKNEGDSGFSDGDYTEEKLCNYDEDESIPTESQDDEYESFHDEHSESDFQSGPPRDSTTILYSGRPSLLSFVKSLLLIALSLGSAIWFREQFDWILSAGICVALIIYIQAQFRRNRHQYYITPKQVEVIHGLILEDSREICIEDIGAIHIRQRGLQGLLGLATIEFAAAESPMPILAFHNVRSARRIKSLIRRLQDALVYPP